VRVLILSDGVHPFVLGGMQKHSLNLAKHLSLKGDEITLLHCVPHGSKLPSSEEVNKVIFPDENSTIVSKAFYFPKDGGYPGHYIRNSHKYSVELLDYIKEDLNSFDFIYAQGFTGWAFLNAKDKLSSPPIGVNFHGAGMFQFAANLKSKWQNLMLAYFVKRILKKSDVIFSLGGKLNSLFQDLSKATLFETPIGINKDWVRDEVPTAGEKRKFLFVGRYERGKAIEEINHAIRQVLQEEHPPMEFHFVGPIPKIKRIDSADVFYHGKIMEEEALKSHFQNSDVLLCPSYAEGMPTVIIEAMASGMSIIATDVGAVSTMYDDQNGLLIEPGSVEEIKNALLHYAKMEPEILLQQKRHSMRLFLEKFTWERVIEKTRSAIYEAIGTPRV
jgi:glycosyltransferase involved in cell wall biosynthesis